MLYFIKTILSFLKVKTDDPQICFGRSADVFSTFQVTIEYKFDRGMSVPLRVHSIVMSVQHDQNVSLEQLRRELKEKVVNAVVPSKYLDEQTVIHLNPAGNFVMGGPIVSLYFITYFDSSNIL